ncbi:Flavodoxin [Geoglobus ahangari]|uniref:Flavodoxin n=1 Tax=Geoglobus ahangari TaxID=113653 RepID=A0A0F7DBY3_9EURY|nr:hypothetical protein [Geoglobus ahangari]AKG91891.1 Flavodoxin [Geoglobus ahangari]
MAEVLFFSYTGNSKRIADAIAERFNLKVREIVPKLSLPYPAWLLLSFIPNLGVPVKEVEVRSDRVVLCFPKWTFNCPPVTSLIKSGTLRGRRVFLITTYGGWRGEQYLRGYAKMLERRGAKVEGMRLVKRSEVEDVLSDGGFFDDLEKFLGQRVK